MSPHTQTEAVIREIDTKMKEQLKNFVWKIDTRPSNKALNVAVSRVMGFCEHGYKSYFFLAAGNFLIGFVHVICSLCVALWGVWDVHRCRHTHTHTIYICRPIFVPFLYKSTVIRIYCIWIVNHPPTNYYPLRFQASSFISLFFTTVGNLVFLRSTAVMNLLQG